MKKDTQKKPGKKTTAKPKKMEQEALVIDDTAYKTKLTRKYLERKPFEELDPGKLTAFIPGKIVDVYVKEGQTVKENELLLILEAMKMHNQIKSPFDALVAKVHVEKGDNVPKNYVIIELTRA